MKQKVCVTFFGIVLLVSLFFVCGGANFEQKVKIEFFYGNESFFWNEPQFNVFSNQAQFQKNERAKPAPKRAELIKKIVKMGFSMEDAFSYVFPNFEDTLKNLCDAVNRPKIEARMQFNPNKYPYFFFEKEQIGLFVDKQKLLENVLKQLEKTNYVKIKVVPNKIMPNLMVENLKKTTYLRSSFSTDFSKSSDNRKQNIALALKNFNGMTILPQKTYSFNKTTGRRTEANGYKQANIILNNEYIESFGGGVCQASTTLFNALLIADVEIVESHSHSLESSYIENGFDAMVNFGSSDLKWKNNTKSPMFVRAFTINERVCVEIYGEKKPYQIKRVCEIIEKTLVDDEIVEDFGLEIGKFYYKTYPKNGSKSKSFLEYYKNGKLVKKKLLRTQTYNAVKGIKVVGRKQPENQAFYQNFHISQQNQGFYDTNLQGQTGFTTWKILEP